MTIFRFSPTQQFMTRGCWLKVENTVGKEMRDINESSDGVKRSALIIFDKFKIKCSDLLTIIEVWRSSLWKNYIEFPQGFGFGLAETRITNNAVA